MHARLFTSLILIDPVISRFTGTPTSSGPAAASVSRRDCWPSRKEAERSFKKSPFYKSWDVRALKQWVEYGLRNLPGQEEVTLTTTKHQEVFTYVRSSSEAYDPEGKEVVRRDLVPDLDTTLNEKWPTYPVYRPEGPRTLAALPSLRPSVLYIFGGQSEISTPELRNEKLALTGTAVGGSGGVESGRVKSIVIASSGHLVPLEVPRLCTQAAVEWIEPALEQWWADERAYESWTRRSASEKRTISGLLERDIKRMRIPGGVDAAKM